jgi:ketosteroid isomerase-like protein
LNFRSILAVTIEKCLLRCRPFRSLAQLRIEKCGRLLALDGSQDSHCLKCLGIDWQRAMVTYILAILCLVPAYAPAGPLRDIAAIHHLIEQYAKAVDTVDLNLLSQIWSHSPEVSFIYPLGEEHGFDAIEQHVFRNIMGGMFSARALQTRDVAIHVSGNVAWSEFHWVFHATMRKDGSAVTTHGVETQIYRRESGKWRLVHVHYSEDRRPVP